MASPTWIISASWLLFFAYWVIMAVGVKRSVSAHPWRTGGWLRVVVIVLVPSLIFRAPASRQALRWVQQELAAGGMVLGFAGAMLCALGVGFAIWARVYLGRNWGMPMSRKENPELVTGGPYAYVRHPIYGGLLIAMLGSTLGGMVSWLAPLLLCAGFFVYSARNEERLMLEEFPEQYPAYMKRTKMFVPFLF